jgi:hypothetical protein
MNPFIDTTALRVYVDHLGFTGSHLVARITDMGIMRNWVSGAIITAMLATTATPAFARQGGYYGGGGYGGQYGHRRHHERGVSAGDVIAGVAILGVFAAIASAASKPKAPRYPQPVYNDYPERDDDSRVQQSQRGTITSENAAVDACATAAEQRGGSTSSVREITTVNADSDGWDVEGVIEQRSDWRDRNADRKSFSCSVRFGSVETVYIDGGSVALR